MEKLIIKSPWSGEEEVMLYKAEYKNGGMYLGLVCEEEGYIMPYADLTVWLEPTVGNAAYVDTNNLPFAEEFIEENHLGEPTGLMRWSGYCRYPLYTFDMERIKAVCME